MAIESKKRRIVSYEKMSREVALAFAEKYPRGYDDFLYDLKTYPKPDGTSFEAVTIEVPDGIYLVKIQVDRDDISDVNRWIDGDVDNESPEAAVEGPEDGATLPDDNLSQYGSSEDDSSDSDE